MCYEWQEAEVKDSVEAVEVEQVVVMVMDQVVNVFVPTVDIGNHTG